MTYCELETLIRRHMEAYPVPGISVAVTDGRETLWEGHYGLSDRESGCPVWSGTRFQQGSITKVLTALALMQLRDRGEFDPHRPVREHLSWLEFPRGGEGITGHHLLTHTSGLPLVRDDVPSSPFMAYLARECTLVDTPGVSYHQSEIGFQVLWCLLEKLAGKPYHRLIADEILRPLGMNDSEARIVPDSSGNLATGYQYLYDDRPNHSSYPLARAPRFEYLAGDGCLVSTASDMAILMRTLLNRGVSSSGHRLISEESYELMTRPLAKRWEGSFYGYGLYVRYVDGHKIIGHGGGMPGFQSMMLGDLDLGVGVVVCINGPGSPLFPFYCAMYALALLRAQKEGLPAPEEAPLPERVRVANAGEYAGEYRGTERVIRVSEDDDGCLSLHWGVDAGSLESLGGDVMVCCHPTFSLYALRFVRDSTGRVVEIEHGEDVYRVPNHPGQPEHRFPSEWRSFVGHYRMYSPWAPANFRVVLRRGRLILITPGTMSYGGSEDQLFPAESGVFLVGANDSPDRVEFTDIVDGRALRARLCGSWHYRVSMA